MQIKRDQLSFDEEQPNRETRPANEISPPSPDPLPNQPDRAAEHAALLELLAFVASNKDAETVVDHMDPDTFAADLE
jgi:hypothetical protein